MTDPRQGTVHRVTNETNIEVVVHLDQTDIGAISTGIGFLDHMLTALAKHAQIGLRLRCAGDLGVDDHHSVEDCALAIGQAIDQAMGDRRGVSRFGTAYVPMDESLCRTVLDFSGRPYASVLLGFTNERIGDICTENITHFFVSLAMASRCCVHMDLIRGSNNHHIAEAAFKSFAIALRQAIATHNNQDEVPSTKGTLT